MRGRSDNRNGSVADRECPDAMLNGDGNSRLSTLDLPDDLLRHRLRHRPVRRVVETEHALALMVIAHEAEEDRDPASIGCPHLVDQGVEPDRLLGQDGHYPPATGGRSATSSP